MDRDAYIALWQQEEQVPFLGWDFSYLKGRMTEEQPPWSYSARAAEVLQGAASVLDMGTGGGERLLKLREHWPAKVVVTEDYPPNVRLARERLSPLGVRVEVVELTRDGVLPFDDAGFDVVLNRQSGFNPVEVARVLMPGGTFLMQQIDGRWAHDLMAVFGASPQWPDETLVNCVAWIKDAGLTIVTENDWSGRFAFTDVGAIVYYLRAVQWIVPSFSVATHLDGLLALQARLEKEGVLSFAAKKFLIEARKPA
ncbi:MAG: methyltransferase domain-containing protein [Anaerolineae bacterium]|nr:methyltransferase domain-containing protein [Anaerolineae bacterium]